jgi:hypothetical protein
MRTRAQDQFEKYLAESAEMTQAQDTIYTALHYNKGFAWVGFFILHRRKTDSRIYLTQDTWPQERWILLGRYASLIHGKKVEEHLTNFMNREKNTFIEITHVNC